jgi:hypothetical protein
MKVVSLENWMDLIILKWWAEPDLNWRPFDYQSNAPAVLSYRPT